jgi:adenylate cyclase
MICIGSVLFTDLVGFTEFNGAAGDEAAVRVLEQQSAMARVAVNGSTDGRIVKELGDGLMMWFGSACEGLDTATTLMSTLDDARSSGDFPLAVRMGMHHGQAIARGDDIVGQTVNIAARVADLAGPGELLVSDQVVAACSPATRQWGFHPIGPVIIKGVADPVWIERWSL